MSKLKSFIKVNLNKDLILYMLFGAGTTVVNYFIFWLLAWLIKPAEGSWLYLLINIAAWIGAVLFAYVTNKLWVFRTRGLSFGALMREFFSFVLARLASLGLEELGIFIFINVLKYNALVVKLSLAIVVVLSNYFLSKYWIFRKEKPADESE